MNIALYDGNNEDLKRLESCLRELVDHNSRLAVFRNRVELLDKLSRDRTAFDIYLLPVESDRVNGLRIAEEIRKVNLNALIIFISQDTKQMSTVFEFHAFDYLLKPVTVEKVETTLKRAKRYLSGNQSYVEFSFKKEKFLLLMDEIIYVTKSGRIAYIHTKDEVYKSYLTMSEILSKLNDGRFIRIHGSYVINLNYVTKIVKDEVFLYTPEKDMDITKETSISVSRRFKEEFQQCVTHLKIPQGKL